jgi:hypothetical protein
MGVIEDPAHTTTSLGAVDRIQDFDHDDDSSYEQYITSRTHGGTYVRFSVMEMRQTVQEKWRRFMMVVVFVLPFLAGRGGGGCRRMIKFPFHTRASEADE